MNVLVILAHSDPNSINATIAKTAVAQLTDDGHEVIFHDLYAEQFDPILFHHECPKDAELPEQIQQHCHDITKADGIVIVHPNWWGQPPAILKGWIDRIIRPGVAYRFIEHDSGEGIPEGLLKAQTAIILNTSNTSAEREEKIFGDPLERIWKDCIFDLCGVKNFYRKMFRIVVTSTPEERTGWLEETKQIMRDYFKPA